MESNLSPTEAEIQAQVQAAQTGDQESFAWLYEQFFDIIFRFIQRKAKSEEAEDLTSEVFMKMIEKLHLYRPQKSARFVSWLFRIAHHTVIDWYRRTPLEFIPLADDEEINTWFNLIPDQRETPDKKAQRLQDSKKLSQAISRLLPDQREIIELKFLEEFSNREIANVTGKTEPHIRILQWRAIKSLRTHWDKL